MLNRSSLTGVRLALFILLAGICLTACTRSAAPDAKDTEVVNVYNWADYIAHDTIARFEAETGIRVNYDTYDTSETVGAKLLAGNSGYDVVVHGGQYYPVIIPTGAYQALDRDRLSNWRHLDPHLLNILAGYDPENRFAAPYMWGTTGFAYNVDMILERMPEAPVESGDMLFNPEVVSQFADCGVSFLDSATVVIPMALVYLGLQANTTSEQDIAQAEALLLAVRPYIRYFSSAKLLNDLPNREVCLGMSWSGDYSVALARAREAGIDIKLAYSMPVEGSVSWFDGVVIPSDAAHVDNAYRFIDFVLRPDVLAQISAETGYANASRTARQLMTPQLLNDPAIYPTKEMLARVQPYLALPPKFERLRTRAFARLKRGH